MGKIKMISILAAVLLLAGCGSNTASEINPREKSTETFVETVEEVNPDKAVTDGVDGELSTGTITGEEEKLTRDEITADGVDGELSTGTITGVEEKFTWDEITADGVDEELLFDNIDVETLNTIGKELQTLVDEETEAERANPEIVITEGWTRVFKSERYKRVLALGQAAMKPLYLIVYKSENAGAYEYICARALYELAGCDFNWVNSKDFLEKFNEKVISEKK